MRQERFTEMAQEAIALSQQTVQEYNHAQWDVEHVLLALVTQEKGLVRDILRDMGVDADNVKNQVNSVLEKIPKVTYGTGQIYATPRIQSLFTAADAEAKRLQDEFISTEHIFIAIASEGRGESFNILHNMGVDKEKLYSVLQKPEEGTA